MTGKRTQLGPDEWSFVPSRAVSAAGNSCGSKEEAGSGSLSSERPLRMRQGRALREGGSMGYLLPGGGMTTSLSHLWRSAPAGGIRVRPASQCVCVYRLQDYGPRCRPLPCPDCTRSRLPSWAISKSLATIVGRKRRWGSRARDLPRSEQESGLGSSPWLETQVGAANRRIHGRGVTTRPVRDPVLWEARA